jgi:hypothetical protein
MQGSAMDLEDEETWLHHHVLRLRLLLRYVRSKQGEPIIKDLISNAEARLEAMADERLKNPK